MTGLKVFYQLTLRDKNGKIVKSTHKRLSRSFVIQFLQMIEASGNLGNVTIKDVSNTNRTCAVTTVIQGYHNAGVGDASFGMVVGSNSTAPTNTDYALNTLIAHGSGAGQLNYGIQSKIAAQVVGANVDYTITRTFQNLSGGDVTVEEIGLYEEHTNAAYKFLAIRDVTGTITVANGQTLTGTYTLRTTV